ncbi:N-acetylmuramoyl-L-alanine amidase C-terminal domain-containing protein [Bacillus sp. 17RED48]|uniref:N-acetylmuramoyl-L-alanine amidase C-terminal domain-containing protein n=1 Tax=Bacillus sp. 17RED48 TaxID=2778093 RepID=UPI0035B4A617
MGTSIYCNSAIGELLQNARECCDNVQLKTKKGLSKYLGITHERLTRIESGLSKPEFELAMDWCHATGAQMTGTFLLQGDGLTFVVTDPTSDAQLKAMKEYLDRKGWWYEVK